MQADWQASRDGAPALVAGRSLRCPMADGSSGAGHLTDSDYELDVNSGDFAAAPPPVNRGGVCGATATA